jgi:carbon monoxide dehydrogenase subunit G
MPKVSLSTQLGVAADDVWKMIGEFNALPDWHPAVQSSELADGGQQRTLSLAGGGTIVETLVNHDNGGMTYTYQIKDSPLPVANYEATITVSPDGERSSKVEWSGDFDAAGAPENEAVQVIQGIYQAGLDNLRKMFGG